MDYKKKYMKYKNKYIILKKQIGSSTSAIGTSAISTSAISTSAISTSAVDTLYPIMAQPLCIEEYGEKKIGCDIPFNNKHGTCWLISILVIFFYGDSSSTCVQHKLNTTIINEENIRLLNYILPNSIVKQYDDGQRNIEEEFTNLMNKLQHIYRIKRADELKLSTSEDSTPRTRQVLSDQLETDFTKLFILLLDDTRKQNKIDTTNRFGANIQHEFFLVNILSCLFLNRLIEFKYFAVNTVIDIKSFLHL